MNKLRNDTKYKQKILKKMFNELKKIIKQVSLKVSIL